jgi:hypothetical protein
MKKEINAAAKAAPKVGEIFLFREMANSLSMYTRAMFIQEVHGRKGWVQFPSVLTGKNETKEIADLLIICKNKKNEIKISFLQAKFHKRFGRPFLKFHGDYLQLELLQTRPNINPNNIFRFPSNILNFSNYFSLTTYGIFYIDHNNEINLLYTIAVLLRQMGTKLTGGIMFPGHPACPHSNCFTGMQLEVCSTCEIDLYERALLSFMIGAPIIQEPSVSQSIRKMLSLALSQYEGSDAELIRDFIDALHEIGPGHDETLDGHGYPNILLINSIEAANTSFPENTR